MKKHSIFSTINRLILALLFTLSLPLAVAAQNDASPDRIAELDELSNEELINSVKLGKYSDLVVKFQDKEAKRLLKDDYRRADGCNVEMFRNREVIIITIPAANLFSPNSIRLTSEADKYLNPLKRFVKTSRPDMYRMLLVMHTDDTGSTSYTDNLSLNRVEAIYDFLDGAGADTRYIFPTAAGATDPLEDNDSVEKRAKNRRLEVYLIPGKKMLDSAKKGRISF